MEFHNLDYFNRLSDTNKLKFKKILKLYKKLNCIDYLNFCKAINPYHNPRESKSNIKTRFGFIYLL